MESLSDEMLIEAYVTVKHLHLSPDFISLLEVKLFSRNLVKVIGSLPATEQ